MNFDYKINAEDLRKDAEQWSAMEAVIKSLSPHKQEILQNMLTKSPSLTVAGAVELLKDVSEGS